MSSEGALNDYLCPYCNDSISNPFSCPKCGKEIEDKFLDLDNFIIRYEVKGIIPLIKISHAFFLISAKIFEFLADKNREKNIMENNYKYILESINRVHAIKAKTTRSGIVRNSLYHHRASVNDALNLYVNELQKVRDRNYRKYPIIISIIVSVLITFLDWFLQFYNIININ